MTSGPNFFSQNSKNYENSPKMSFCFSKQIIEDLLQSKKKKKEAKQKKSLSSLLPNSLG